MQAVGSLGSGAHIAMCSLVCMFQARQCRLAFDLHEGTIAQAGHQASSQDPNGITGLPQTPPPPTLPLSLSYPFFNHLLLYPALSASWAIPMTGVMQTASTPHRDT